MNLDRKYFGLIVALFMTLALDSTMTFAMTSINAGWTESFLQIFLRNWVIGFVIAFPTSILVLPLARKTASKLTSE